MPRTCAIWAEAGGVGKTTFATNIAAALGRLGHDVLAIDLDHQRATMTEWTGFGHLSNTEDELNITDCIVEEDHSLSEVIVDAGDFDLAPSHTDLARFEQRVAGESLPVFFLREEIENLSAEYEYFIVDAPASRGLLSDNAIVAMRNLLVPMPMGHKGHVSVQGIEETVEAMESGLSRMPGEGIDLSILGVVPNKLDPQRNIEEAALEHLEDRGIIIPRYIRKRGCLEEAWNAHLSIFEYAEEYGLREYESDLPEKFTDLARFITGEWTPDNMSDDDEERTALSYDGRPTEKQSVSN